MSALEILNLLQQLTYNNGVFTHKVLGNNSSLVTSPTTPTPGITSTCQGQGSTCLKLAYPSLERVYVHACVRVYVCACARV